MPRLHHSCIPSPVVISQLGLCFPLTIFWHSTTLVKLHDCSCLHSKFDVRLYTNPQSTYRSLYFFLSLLEYLVTLDEHLIPHQPRQIPPGLGLHILDHRPDALHTSRTAFSRNLQVVQSYNKPITLILERPSKPRIGRQLDQAQPAAITWLVFILVAASTKSVAERRQGVVAQRRGLFRQ